MPLINGFIFDRSRWKKEQLELGQSLQWTDSPQSSIMFLETAILMSDHTFRNLLSGRYSIPTYLWRSICQRSNGYFGCEDFYDDEGILMRHTTWFKFQIKQLCDGPEAYVWYDLTFFTMWKRPGVHSVLCFDIPPIFQGQILEFLMKDCSQMPYHDIYGLHTVFISQALESYDRSVWTLRDRVRYIEKRRMGRTEPETDYPMLHELARHACHSSETLLVAVETITSMHTQCGSFLGERTIDTPRSSSHMQKYLAFQQQLFKGLLARSVAVEARLKNEMNLAINLVAQQESAATVRISKAAQSDGAAMKAVAVITLLFLPSTFVSTIFSMTFFSFVPGGDGVRESWIVSEKIWIYWLFTVPLTVAAMATWFWWQRRNSLRSSSVP